MTITTPDLLKVLRETTNEKGKAERDDKNKFEITNEIELVGCAEELTYNGFNELVSEFNDLKLGRYYAYMVQLRGDFNLNKILLYIILGIIFFVFFFPIKMAVNEKDIKSLNNLEYYIIKPTDATGGFWVGYNDKENEIYFINFKGNSFEDDLGSSILGDYNTVRLKNKFIIYGKKI